MVRIVREFKIMTTIKSFIVAISGVFLVASSCSVDEDGLRYVPSGAAGHRGQVVPVADGAGTGGGGVGGSLADGGVGSEVGARSGDARVTFDAGTSLLSGEVGTDGHGSSSEVSSADDAGSEVEVDARVVVVRSDVRAVEVFAEVAVDLVSTSRPEARAESGTEGAPDLVTDRREVGPDVRKCAAECFAGCNVGCGPGGQCQACATCTCSVETGVCHC